MTDIILADPNRLFREGLKRIIGKGEFDVISEFASASEASTVFEGSEMTARLLICDPSSDPIPEFAALKSLRARFSSLRVMLLTDSLTPRLLMMALDSGADGYLPKNISSEALRYSIEIILLEEEIFPTLVPLLCNCAAEAAPAATTRSETPIAALSLREGQILRCLMNGTSNKGIARELQMAEATVKVHLKSLLRKLNAINRTQAAICGVNDPSLLDLKINGRLRVPEEKMLIDI